MQEHAKRDGAFVNDVEPVLTRFGCNSGGCHGKLAGQNGFRLSLRGYAPEADHVALNGIDRWLGGGLLTGAGENFVVAIH